MSLERKRYVEGRRGGTDPVGSLGARRISKELRSWISNEAKRTGRTQRAVIEDAIESFISYRKKSGDKFQYENIPKNVGGTFRVFIKFDLLEDVLDMVKKDGIFNGDLINAAIKHEMKKDGMGYE